LVRDGLSKASAELRKHTTCSARAGKLYPSDTTYTRSFYASNPGSKQDFIERRAEYSEGELQSPVHRAELVANQIPIAIDFSAIPVRNLPLPSPIEENQPKLQCLVVDDDPLTRRLMTRMITRIGHEVICAEDGEIALNLLREAWTQHDETRYDIVFLDNYMPRLSGVECVREVRRIGLRVFICGVTGNALKEDQEEYLAAGVDKVLTKPVLERNVRAAIEEARQRAEELRDLGTDRITPMSDTVFNPSQ